MRQPLGIAACALKILGMIYTHFYLRHFIPYPASEKVNIPTIKKQSHQKSTLPSAKS